MNAISFVASAFANDYLVTLIPDGEDCQTYRVSCATLCETSEYFRAALQGNFREVSSGILTFPGFDDKTLQGFVYWLSEGDLPDHEDFLSWDVRDRDEQDFNERLLEWELLLIRLWAFGDQHLLPRLQNRAMIPLLQAMMEQTLAPQAVREIFERTAKDAQLRRAATIQVTGDLTGTYYQDDEVEELSQIPGLLVAVMNENRKCHGGLKRGCKCDVLCCRVDGRQESFMVE
ncbi:hypothetical protein EJ03DRAFT_351045 [Teratosphaeria nubilosa]|uniref:BTB domain-containing protein n=1 Tax=Teratosphaeria nubilosa TaxID=161662 RepID=A0A6G1LBI2_9PEZI|nr:hypothetical protein EJ03DRAFT_351045 [Teratosphaeria nubilosa]